MLFCVVHYNRFGHLHVSTGWTRSSKQESVAEWDFFLTPTHILNSAAHYTNTFSLQVWHHLRANTQTFQQLVMACWSYSSCPWVKKTNTVLQKHCAEACFSWTESCDQRFLNFIWHITASVPDSIVYKELNGGICAVFW